MTNNYYERIADRLLANPEQVLLIWPDQWSNGQSYSGRDILNRVSGVRAGLDRKQVRPGELVLLAMPVTFDLICALLAIMAMGAVPVLPPAAASPRTLLRLLRQGGSSVMLTHRKLNGLFSWLVKRSGVNPVCLEDVPEGSAQWLPPQPVDPDQPALISHSSGSTGVAKSIRRSHRVLLAQHQALNLVFPPWPEQRDFPLFPNILLHNLALGTVSILPDLPGFRLTGMEPARIVAQLVSQRVETLTGNVYYVQTLLHHLEKQPCLFPGVRALGIGGSPVPEYVMHGLQRFFTEAAIYVIYGSSEAEPIAVRKASPARMNPRAGYAVGLVHPSLQLQLRPAGTNTSTDASAYRVGEICVKGAHVAAAGNDWFQTGDFGYLDDAGQLFLTGRRGNERAHQGVQHYQVEHVLAHVDGVTRVAARSTEPGFTVYVQGKANEDDLWAALAAFPPGIVNHIYFRKQLPVDARHQSKIRYDQLR